MNGFELQPIIKPNIGKWLSGYWYQLEQFISAQERWNKENNILETRIDYLKLKRFLNTALRNFMDIDTNFIADPLLSKLNHNITSMHELYNTVVSQTMVTETIYYRDFLPSIPSYKLVIDKLDELANQASILQSDYAVIASQIKISESKNLTDNLKKLKNHQADVVHSIGNIREQTAALKKYIGDFADINKEEFIKEFKIYRQKILDRLIKIINTHSHYLDRVLWDRASSSLKIRKFMRDSNIVGDYDTKTFIQYYLKNINASESATPEWHNYLALAVKLLD